MNIYMTLVFHRTVLFKEQLFSKSEKKIYIYIGAGLKSHFNQGFMRFQQKENKEWKALLPTLIPKEC